MLLLVDVHHVAGFVIGKADVLAHGRLELHVRYSLLDAVEGRGNVIIAAEDEHFEVGLLRHRGAQHFRHFSIAGLIPWADIGAHRVVLIGVPLQLAARVVVERRHKGALVGRFTWVVLHALSSRVCVHPFKSRIKPSDGLALVAFQLLEPTERANAQIRLFDVLWRESGEAGDLRDDFLMLGGRELVSFFECLRVVAVGKFARFRRDLIYRQTLQVLRQEVVVPRRRRIGGQEENRAIVRAPVGKCHRGEQHDAAQVNLVALLQDSREFRRARRTIAFANQKFRGGPSFIARDVLIDEISEPVRIGDDSVELVWILPGRGPAVAGRDSVDKDQVRCIQE